jgi:PAS domain S-box-containing protein
VSIKNLVTRWSLLISLLFGLLAFFVIYADMHFAIPGTTILTDPREFFVLIGSALSGPIGAGIIGLLSSIYDPTPELRLYIILQHAFGAILISILYKKYIYEKLLMPAFILGWVTLIFIYYYILYIPGYFITYFLFPNIYNVITGSNPNPIAALQIIFNGWIFEFLFTSLITTLFFIALPQRFRIPLWGSEKPVTVSDSQKKVLEFISDKFFSHNYLGVRLGVWFLFLSLMPFFAYHIFVHNDLRNEIEEFQKQQHISFINSIDNPKLELWVQDISQFRIEKNNISYDFIYYGNDKPFIKETDANELLKKLVEQNLNQIAHITDQKNNILLTSIKIEKLNKVVVIYSSLDRLEALYSELEKDLGKHLGISMLIITLITGISIGLIVVVPIKKITRALFEFGEGNYNRKIPVAEMDDELQVMAGSFNEMTEKIKTAHEQVAEEVENRLLAEATMMKSEENLEHITNNILDVVLETDSKGLVKYASPSTDKVLKRLHKDFIGCKFLDIVDHKNVENVSEVLAKLKESRKPIQFEFRLKVEESSDQKVFLESICNPLINDNDEVTGFIFTLRDITERKEFERNLKKAKEKAEKSDKLKSEFLAQMSHEIRTPINSILNFTQLIKYDVEDKLTEDLKDSFTIINTSSNRLIRTIDSILNLSQLQQGSYDINPTKFNLVENIQRVIDEFKSIAAQKKLSLQLKTTEDKIYVFADAYMVSQLAVNLIDNAIKYTEAGEILVDINNIDDNVNLVVKDTGIGMSEEYLKKLFEPFSQEYTGYSRRFEGTGLGLALVRRYCEISNAQIDVKSEKGRGTTFTIVFS